MNVQRNSSPQLILVNERDEIVGYCPKLEAHQNGGVLHRAFSVFVFNARGEMLLQQRAASKYHFACLWSNACCSHPLRGEETPDAAHERLQHELGFQTPLEAVCQFVYRAEDSASGLTEHEFDHVFRGHYDGEVRPNPEEIAAWKWMSVPDLRADLRLRPQLYTPWFQIVLEQVLRFDAPRAESAQPDWPCFR